MRFRLTEGNFIRIGAYKEGNTAVFTFAAQKEDECNIVLTDIAQKKKYNIEVPAQYSLGSLRSVRIHDFDCEKFSYYYLLNGVRHIDPYATIIYGREKWNDCDRAEKDYEIECGIDKPAIDWKKDIQPEIGRDRMKLYKLHVRGFSMDTVQKNKHAGTFEAVSDRIMYIKKMGFTSLLLMPVYEFEEMTVPIKHVVPDYVKPKYSQMRPETEPGHLDKADEKVNFWGYTRGNYFAVKASYANEPSDAANEFARLVQRLHKNNMECIMEMYFPDNTDHNLILSALHYWVQRFHVDGFRLLGDKLPLTAIIQDAMLSRTKILYDSFDMSVVPKDRRYENLYIDRAEYQFPARMMLNHINCNMNELLNQQRKQGENIGFINYIADNNGFTLTDLFMYNDRHNETNGENNTDGPSWNFSNNYGFEGPSKKKYVRDIRGIKWKDAMLMLFLAQGVPMIMAGDEICNSQSGNNNAYCQDNSIGWVNWANESSRRENVRFLTRLIRFRNEHPVISAAKPYKFCDYKAVGYPDISYHGKNAWIGECDPTKLCVGVMYCGDYSDEDRDYIYVAYNFYSSREKLALPKLKKGMKWYAVCDSSLKTPFYENETVCENQQYADVSPQSICILLGK